MGRREPMTSNVGMSRSAFAARFTQLVGEPAMRHVARWKMHAALMWLKDDDVALGELASRLGYESEAAFSSFKRLIGISTGRGPAECKAVDHLNGSLRSELKLPAHQERWRASSSIDRLRTAAGFHIASNRAGASGQRG